MFSIKLLTEMNNDSLSSPPKPGGRLSLRPVSRGVRPAHLPSHRRPLHHPALPPQHSQLLQVVGPPCQPAGLGSGPRSGRHPPVALGNLLAFLWKHGHVHSVARRERVFEIRVRLHTFQCGEDGAVFCGSHGPVRDLRDYPE